MLVAHSDKLYRKMQERLQEISSGAVSELLKADQAYHLVCEIIKEVKAFVNAYDFTCNEEEIQCFKVILPKFLKEGIFYQKLYTFESNKPIGSVEPIKAYYDLLTNQIQLYIKEHQILYLYYRTSKTHLDDLLFVSQPGEIPMFPFLSTADDRFSNVYSFKLAKLMAFEDLISYLESQKEIVGLPNRIGLQKEDKDLSLTWTASKAQLIELAYGLHSGRVFNDGQVDLKQIMHWLEYSFNTKVSNFYGYFQSMRIRKKDRVPFLSLMRDLVLKRMDESDEFPRGRG